MNINRFLCKHFDDDKKGYVTIGDVVLDARTCSMFASLAIITFLADVIGSVYYNDESGRGFLWWENIRDVLFGYFVYIILTAICVILITISQIKIAKCELKNKEE